MKFAVYSIYFALVLGACSSPQSSEKRLPIMGNKQIEPVKVNGRTVADTIYHTIPDFAFVDQDSQWVTPETFENKVYVADFFFTSCPTICPTMKKQMLRVYDAYKDNDQVALLSHTIDPEYDTVALLRDYAHRLGVSSNTWHFVTGDKSDIYEIGQRSYLVTAGEDEDAPGGYIHSGAFVLIDKERRIRGLYDGTKADKVTQLIADIEVLLSEYDNKEG